MMPQDYWKVRALSAQLALELERREMTLAPLRDRLRLAMGHAGLNPDEAYTFNDDTETIVPKDSPQG